MEIDYDVSKKFYRHIDELLGVIIDKKKILKNKRKRRRIKTCIRRGVEATLLLIAFRVCHCWNNLFMGSEVYGNVVNYFSIAVILYIIMYYATFLYFYFNYKSSPGKGKLLIDEIGITDNSESGILIKVNWEKIESVVITKNTISIIADSEIRMFIENTNKEEIIKAISEYKKDMLIIDESIK